MCYKETTKMPPMPLVGQAVTSDQFQMFDVSVRKRRRLWLWSVSTAEGEVIVEGAAGAVQLPNIALTAHFSCCCCPRPGSSDCASGPEVLCRNVYLALGARRGALDVIDTPSGKSKNQALGPQRGSSVSPSSQWLIKRAVQAKETILRRDETILKQECATDTSV